MPAYPRFFGHDQRRHRDPGGDVGAQPRALVARAASRRSAAGGRARLSGAPESSPPGDNPRRLRSAAAGRARGRRRRARAPASTPRGAYQRGTMISRWSYSIARSIRSTTSGRRDDEHLAEREREAILLWEAGRLDEAGVDRVHARSSRWASSTAIERENASCACFVAEYGPTATVPATETMFTTCEPGAEARQERVAGTRPSRGSSCARAPRSRRGRRRRRAAGPAIPALLTSRSMRGCRSSTRAATASTASRSETSHCSYSCASSAGRRERPTTCQPARGSCRHSSAPMPDDAPVTTATRMSGRP